MTVNVINAMSIMNGEGRAIKLRAPAPIAEAMIHVSFGGLPPQLTGLKIRTTCLMDGFQTQDPSNHSLMIEGRVARIQPDGSYWLDDHATWEWDGEQFTHKKGPH